MPSHVHAFRPPPTGLGFLLENGALYLGTPLQTTTHVAHAYKIYIAIHGRFDLLLDRSRRWTSLHAVVIAPDRPHKIVGDTAIVALVYLVPETPAGHRISRYYSRLDAFVPPQHFVADLIPRLQKIWEQSCCHEEASQVSSDICSDVLPTPRINVSFDRRVVSAIEYLEEQLGRRVTIAELASAVALSPSRFEHLFSEQVGIPVSRYLLWARLRKALGMIPLGKPLTEVAYRVGFADSAHLSRTFRRMLGIAPSTILKSIAIDIPRCDAHPSIKTPTGDLTK
jgi:AraC family transcriptional regulator